MTTEALVQSDEPVTLVGAGPVKLIELNTVLALAPVPVAADGGASHILAAGIMPDQVIGDFDSLDLSTHGAIPVDRLHHVAEQDSTDFHKCLSRIEAPVTLAVGFTGGRMDHLLAVFNVLVRLPERRCIVVGPEDVCVLAPPRLEIDLPKDTTVSLFPMAPVTAQSDGLNWPVDGLEFEPHGQIGTSNHCTGPLTLTVDAPKMLLLAPKAHLGRLMDALKRAPTWT
ncbi:MAG: thiamine diphosphokinase [Pseudomonadota bacterium]